MAQQLLMGHPEHLGYPFGCSREVVSLGCQLIALVQLHRGRIPETMGLHPSEAGQEGPRAEA